MQMMKMVMVTSLLFIVATGCDVDKNHQKYDQLRYEQLQKARCVDMATLLSASFVNAEPEDYDKALKRCEDMKLLSFDAYKQLSDHARATGSWDIYELFPEGVEVKKQ